MPCRSLFAAAFASCLVYAVPLLSPHGAVFVGETISRLESGARNGQNPWAFVAAVLAAQAALGASVFLTRGLPSWRRGATLLVAWLGALVALNVAFFVVIPLVSLLEPETRSEVSGLVEECRRPGFSLHNWTTPPELAAAGQALLYSPASGTLHILHMPDCQVEPLPIPGLATSLTLRAGGAALWALLPPPGDRYHWHFARVGEARAVTIDGWEPKAGAPLLLADGRTVAWVRRNPGPDGLPLREPPWAFVHTQGLAGDDPREVPLGGDPGSFELVDGAGPDGPFVVRHQARQTRYLRVAADSKLSELGAAPRESNVSQAFDRVVLLPIGWLGWDVYAEDRRYRVAWSLPAGAGRVEIPRGSGVHSAAADPGGRFVAYATSSRLNIGWTKDAVVLLRARDSMEVFRRYFPRYHRSEVALLGSSRFFAITENDASAPRVTVYRLPEG